ncbi:MAG: phosphate signaling complex protein PhoU [Opitutales bacterium]|jgi:phosphate transport system protein|nr:phosphate signaling complex protein PhoU [Opitutales bacterium]MBT5170451.1 phosphate signaling complex protein PhoU [Opitutales bacterium]MBT5816204.1 phosphate signaling complex protein PhoU [Opitutales bacterium]MBT6380941.1 phosphate signaling complex protein PhoU [Opitutales bacterium]MBT6767497.1 phosphate signaling complex protein PhoU [Opitutales bacterium]
MKRYFHEELEDVRSHLMLMGEKAVESVKLAMQALLESDVALADQVMKSDDVIDDIEKQIDDEVVRYVSLRAPVARDLRLLFVAIKASHDLERVGDEASNIAGRTKKIIAQGLPIDAVARVPRMCELAINMLDDALRSFIQEEETLAYSIVGRDKEVDTINRENFKEFVELMKSDPANVAACTEMVFISKSFERIADHAKNIAEEVFYLLTTQSLKEVTRGESLEM